MDPSQLIKYPEAAKRCGVSERTLKRLVAKGRMRVVRPSPGSVCFRIYDIENYLNRNSSGGPK